MIHGRKERNYGGMFVVESLDLEFANGERRRYERLQSSGLGAVIIVPMLDDQTVLLIREYACGVHGYEIGLPKGRLEADETILEAANRELKEEAGYGARQLDQLTDLTLAPGYMSHRTHVVLARDLYPERLPGDEPEEIEVIPWPIARIGELIGRADCTEGRTLAALFIARETLAQGSSA
ncbi:MAG: ADP compounds hydrolase NudE [Wenzhouxiangellaceae bacterium]